ncbi:hypothetical protein LG288_04425 [Idiomarina seosinensis]|uniref:hypothetical protein n=1 Tax=Idiomarina seosinensis TaxID=281739 RepID=UPI00384EA8DB
MLEALLGLLLLISTVALLTDYLLPAAHTNQQQLLSNRDLIWARQMDDEKALLSDNYSAAKASGRLLNELSKLVPLDFDNKNLRHNRQAADGAVNQYPMARLTDGWSASTGDALAGRPRLFVINTVLDNSIIEFLQKGIGWLPIAKEVRPDSLIFGHIDTDVVPQQALQKKSN